MNIREKISKWRDKGYRVLWSGVFMTGKDGGWDYLEEHVRKYSNTYLLDDLLNKSEKELESFFIADEKQLLVHHATNYYPFDQHNKVQTGSNLLINGFTNANQCDEELFLREKSGKEFNHLDDVNDIKRIIVAQMKCAYDLGEGINFLPITNIHPEFVLEERKAKLDKKQWYIDLTRKL